MVVHLSWIGVYEASSSIEEFGISHFFVGQSLFMVILFWAMFV